MIVNYKNLMEYVNNVTMEINNKGGYKALFPFLRRFNMDNKEIIKAIEESGLKLKYIADCLGISYMTLYRKLHSKSSWKYEEIEKLKKLLNK